MRCVQVAGDHVSRHELAEPQVRISRERRLILSAERIRRRVQFIGDTMKLVQVFICARSIAASARAVQSVI